MVPPCTYHIHMCYICLHTRAIHHTTYHRGHDHTLPYCGHNAQESNNDNTESNSHEKCTAEQISALGECCILVLGGVYPYSNRHRYHTHCLQICTWDTRYCNCITFLTSSVFPIVQCLVQCLACTLPKYTLWVCTIIMTMFTTCSSNTLASQASAGLRGE